MTKKEDSLFVVDDDPSVRTALKRLLRAWGFNVKTFKSAEDFLDSGLAQCPDLLILDVRMRGMTGIELQRTLIEQGSDIPVIFVTAYDDMDARRVAMEAGGVAFVQKPFDETILIDAIQRGLGRQPLRVPGQVNSE
jgi:FixJ family two-component response regulator